MPLSFDLDPPADMETGLPEGRETGLPEGPSVGAAIIGATGNLGLQVDFILKQVLYLSKMWHNYRVPYYRVGGKVAPPWTPMGAGINRFFVIFCRTRVTTLLHAFSVILL